MVMRFDELPVGEVLEELAVGVRTERLNQNLTQQTLADRAGVSVDTVRKLESGGNATLSVFVKVLRGLGLDGRLELLMPPAAASPIDVARREGRVRERASGTRSTASSPWVFEDPPEGDPPVAG